MESQSGKYYVVTSGRKLGLFDNWELTNRSVRDYSGGKYAVFNSKQEAETYLVSNRSSTIDVSPIPIAGRKQVFTSIYQQDRKSSIGIVIILEDGKRLDCYGLIKETCSAIAAEMYAAHIALSIVSGDVSLFIKYDTAIDKLNGLGCNRVEKQLLNTIKKNIESRSVRFHPYSNIDHLYVQQTNKLAIKGFYQTNQIVIDDGEKVTVVKN